MLTITNKKFYANHSLKKLVMLVGLMLVLLSVFEQTSEDYDYKVSSNAQVSMLQLDKDHQRDVEEAVLAFHVLGNGALLTNVMCSSYSMLYQEPTLLVHHKPPKA